MYEFVDPTRCLKLVSKGFCQVKVICHNPDDLGSILKTPMVEKELITAGCLLSQHESTLWPTDRPGATETEVSLLAITTPFDKS